MPETIERGLANMPGENVIPAPWKHPPPFVTSLSEHGLMASLLLLRKAWTQEAFNEVLKEVGCAPTEVSLRILSPKQRAAQVRNGPPQWYRSFTGHDGLLRKLDSFRTERAQKAGYEPLMLMSKVGTRTAFQCLVETVHYLGLADSPDWPGMRPDPRMLCAAVLALHARADCWTLYSWRDGDGGPRLAGSAGLFYPEALVGSTLASDGIRPQLMGLGDNREPCVEVRREPTSRTSPFATREEVTRCWSVTMRASNGGTLLFLNWRSAEQRAEAPGHIAESKPLAHLLWRERGHGVGVKDPEVLLECGLPYAREPRDLVPTIRYCRGWLSTAPIPEGDVAGEGTAISPDLFQRQLVDLFKEWIEPRAKERRRRAMRFGDTVVVDQLVHSLLSNALETSCKTFAYDARSATLDLRGEQGLLDWKNKPVAVGLLRLQTDRRGLVQEAGTVLGQSIAWQASILLQNVPALPPGEAGPKQKEPRGVDDPNSLLRRRLWGRSGGRTCSELAVPVYAGSEPIGGIAVEATSARALGTAHVPPIEAVSLCVGAMFQLCESSRWTNEREWVFNSFLAAGTAAPRDEAGLWGVLARWGAKRASADIAFLAAASPGSPKDRILAVSVSDRAAVAIQSEQSRLIGVVPTQCGRAGQGVFSGDPVNAELGIMSLLRIPRDVRSAVFAGLKSVEWSNTREHAVEGFLGDKLFEGVLSMPVRPNNALAPLGVLGLVFLRDPNRPRNPVTAKGWRDTERSIQLVGQVVSSLSVAYTISAHR